MGATIGPAARSAVRKVGTVGLPVPDTEIRIVDDAGGREPLPAGQPGEVLVRGPQVMAGYKDRPEETAAALADGWLHTGDIGVLDDDGYLSIVDRKKDMLIYKGYNVYPRELEELLFARAGCRGGGGRRASGSGGGRAAGGVRGGSRHVPRPRGEALLEAVNAQVTPYKRLRELHLVDSIPVSAAGKVLKRELRARLQSATKE